MSDAAVHLQPTVLIGPEGPALWRIAEGPLALALFSELGQAEEYRSAATGGPWQCHQLAPAGLVRLLAECVRSGISAAVLDPSAEGARRVFDLTEVLRQVREDLRAGRPLSWQP